MNFEVFLTCEMPNRSVQILSGCKKQKQPINVGLISTEAVCATGAKRTPEECETRLRTYTSATKMKVNLIKFSNFEN